MPNKYYTGSINISKGEMEKLKELTAHKIAPRAPYTMHLTDSMHPERNGSYKVISHAAIPNGYAVCLDPADKNVNNFSAYKINNMESNLVRIKAKLDSGCSCGRCTARRQTQHELIMVDKDVSYIADTANPGKHGYYVTLGEWHKVPLTYTPVVPIGYRPEYEERTDGKYYRITKMGEEKKAEPAASEKVNAEKAEPAASEKVNAEKAAPAAGPQAEKIQRDRITISDLWTQAFRESESRNRSYYPMGLGLGMLDGFISGSAALQPTRREKMKQITISEMDAGFMVTVGCQSMAVATLKDLVYYLQLYANDPAAVEQAFMNGELMPGQARRRPTPRANPFL